MTPAQTLAQIQSQALISAAAAYNAAKLAHTKFAADGSPLLGNKLAPVFAHQAWVAAYAKVSGITPAAAEQTFQKLKPDLNANSGSFFGDLTTLSTKGVLNLVTHELAPVIVAAGGYAAASYFAAGAGATEATAATSSVGMSTTGAAATSTTAGYTSLTSEAVTAGLTGTTGASAVAAGSAIVSPVIASDAAIAGVGMSAADLATTAGTIGSAASQIEHVGNATQQAAQLASSVSPVDSALSTASNAAITSGSAHLVSDVVNSALKPATPAQAATLATPTAASSPWLTPAVILAALGLLFEMSR